MQTPPEPAQTAEAAARRPRAKGRPIVVGIAFFAAMGFFMVNIVDPYSGATASPDFALAAHTDRFEGQPVQHLAVHDDISAPTITRDSFTVKLKPKPAPKPQPVVTVAGGSSSDSGASAPAVGTPDPGSAQAYAKSALAARGMGQDQFSCLVALWNRESGWNVYASNPSGAYGIPQALPGSKMGAGWQTSATVQINWGLGYISGRYGTPCGAWAHSQSSGWY